MRGRPKTELVLTEAEHEQLTALTLRRKTAQALALRARIVLACAQGTDNKVVASRQRVTPQTVSKWRARFVEHRLDCRRRFKSEPPCRSNIEPGVEADFEIVGCG